MAIAPRAHGSGVLAKLGRVLQCVPLVRRWAEATEPRAVELRAVLVGRCALTAVSTAFLVGNFASGARSLAAVPLGAWVGWRVGCSMHLRSDRARAQEVRRALAPALDRLATCVLAGMSIERALRIVAPSTPGPLGEAFSKGVRALEVGCPRARAYRHVVEHAGGDEIHSVMASLARAERFGTSVSSALLSQAAELRARARAAAETEAQTAPLKMVFPLVFCFLPAFVLLTVAPIAVSAIRTLGGA
ncbi:MAG: type II secretion system F family protein [Actinomycetota bacterium]